MDLEQLKLIIEGGGWWGELVYVSYLAISVLFAPLISLPLWPVALVVYGYSKAVFLTSLANIVGSMLAFVVARTFGRSLVRKLVGDWAMDRVDRWVEIAGWQGFVVLRILAGNYFDYVSFAAGLSKMSVEQFFLVSFTTTLLWTAVVMVFLDRILSLPWWASTSIFVAMFFVGVSGLFATLKIKERRKGGVGHVKREGKLFN